MTTLAGREKAFRRLAKSKFRSRFHLSAEDRQYIAEKGMETIRRHCEDFIRTRLAPATPPNDGRQTPMRGHPVFLAQHACACCCRGCMEKWWKVPKGTPIPPARQARIVDFLMAWIEKECIRGQGSGVRGLGLAPSLKILCASESLCLCVKFLIESDVWKDVEKFMAASLYGLEVPMNDNTLMPDRYAGDEAWQDWFDICSVGGCPAEHAAALRRQVESAMYSTLSKRGVSREEAGADDPVAVFDAYFKLKGSRDKKKPLKSYFAYRIKAEGLKLSDFVCGTLFGSGAGRVHDIVLDWITSIKGWRPRKVKGPDGRRRIEWESAGPAEIAALEPSAESDPAALLDLEPMRRDIDALLERISLKIKVEKSHVAALLYATAQDIPLTDAALLEGLGVGKSRAYAMREKTMDEFRKEARTMEGADSPLFGRLLLKACESSAPKSLRERTGGAR